MWSTLICAHIRRLCSSSLQSSYCNGRRSGLEAFVPSSTKGTLCVLVKVPHSFTKAAAVNITRADASELGLFSIHVTAAWPTGLANIHDAVRTLKWRNASVSLLELPLRLSLEQSRCQILCDLAVSLELECLFRKAILEVLEYLLSGGLIVF